MDVLAIGKAGKAIKAGISGWQSVSLNEQTGEVTAINNNGQTFHWSYPVPKDGKDGVNGLDGISVVNIYKDETNMIYAEFSNGQTVRVGYAPEGPQGPQGIPGPVNMDSQMSDISENPVQNKVIKEYVDIEVDKIKMAKFPNVTIIGEPTINGGQMRGFSANDYARFPFVVDLTNKAFEINFDILTGSNVATQQNIFDSDFGFAFAIRNSRFIFAISSNGQSWDIGESTGTNVVFPNTQYKIKLSWDRTNYKLQVSTNGGASYITDITKSSNLSPYPTQIYIGVGEDHAQVQNSFSGMIDFTNANLIIDNVVRWVGLDVVGIETRLAKDVSNIDAAGEEKIRQIVGGGGGHELTEEHLTGDTYNGKPVYEIVVTGNSASSTNSQVTVYNTADLNIEQLIDISGITTMKADGNYAQLPINHAYNSATMMNTFYDPIYGIRELHTANNRSNLPMVITLKYTKTTD